MSAKFGAILAPSQQSPHLTVLSPLAITCFFLANPHTWMSLMDDASVEVLSFRRSCLNALIVSRASHYPSPSPSLSFAASVGAPVSPKFETEPTECRKKMELYPGDGEREGERRTVRSPRFPSSLLPCPRPLPLQNEMKYKPSLSSLSPSPQLRSQ